MVKLLVDSTSLLGNSAYLKSVFKAISNEEVSQNKSTAPKGSEKTTQLPQTPFFQSIEENLFEIAEQTMFFSSLYFTNPFIPNPRGRLRPFFDPTLEFQYYCTELSGDPSSFVNPPIGLILECLSLAASNLKKLQNEKKTYRV